MTQDEQKDPLNLPELQSYLDRYVSPVLQKKCGENFTIRVEQDQMEAEDHECILKLYRDKRVISTLKMELYRTKPSGFDVLIESETVPEQRRKRYNTLLRMVGLLLSTKMKWRGAKISTITSMAVSWISVLVLHRMGFKVRSVLTENGTLSREIIKMYKNEFNDPEFLASKLAQGKTSKQSKPWKLVTMEFTIEDRKKLRRRVYRELEQVLLPKLGC